MVGAPGASAATNVTFAFAVGYSTQPVCNDTVVANNSVTVANGTVLYACVRLQDLYDPTPGPATNVTVVDDQGVVFPGSQTIAKGGSGYFLSNPFTAVSAMHTYTASGVGANGTVYNAGPDRGYVTVVASALQIQKTVSTNGVCPGETPAQETCVTLRRGLGGVVADAPLRSDQPSTNLGAQVTLVTGNAPQQRASLLRFDLATIPAGATITSATLTLNELLNSGAATVNVYRATAAWSESTVTWASFNNAYDTSTTYASFSNGGSGFTGAINSNLTSLVQQWVAGTPNYGMTLVTPTSTVSTFGSSENSTATSRPTLKVCYMPPVCGTPSSTGVSGVESVTVLSGTAAKYCYQVKNTGTTTIYDISSTDNGSSILVGDLAGGQSRTVSSCFTATADADTFAVASGVNSSTGSPVQSNYDDASVDVIAPALTIATTVSLNGQCPGTEVVNVLTSTPITWCYAVTNSGDSAVKGISITDDVFGALNAPAVSLAPGQSVTLSRPDVSTVDTTLTAWANGTVTATNTAVQSNQDPAAVNVVGPRIDIDVTVSTNGQCPGADTATVPAGTSVQYCYLVSNIGDDTLTNIDVVNQDNTLIASIPLMASGGSQMFAGPSVTITADAQEQATATGTDIYGFGVTSTDLAKVHALFPALTIAKTVSTDGTCPGQELVTVLSGSQVTYCYTVTNTGGVAINGVVVTDNGHTVSVGNLAAGASASVSSAITATADADTFATASGTVAATGQPFSSAPDDAAVDVVNPSLAISKTVSTDGSCPGSELVTILPGTAVTYCYAVTNNGDTDVSGVFIQDAGATIFIGDLAAGASSNAQNTAAVYVDNDTAAIASGTTTVTGTPVTSPQDDAAVDVVTPALTIQKTASTNGACPGVELVTVTSGTPVAYCYVVTNSGDTAVSGITILDNGVPLSVPDLAPGQSGSASRSITATADEDTAAIASGTATVTGTPVDSNYDDAAVQLVHPSLSIQKTASTDGTCPGSELVTVLPNTPVTYCYVVTNNGDTAVGGVTVDDNGVSVTIGDLAPGQSGTGSTVVSVAVDTNTPATASGTTTATGTPVSSPPDGAAIDVVTPALTIQKTASASGTCPGSELITVLSGSAVTYCYTVTNNGDTTVSGIVVSDNGVTVGIGTLAPGQSGSGSAQVVVTSDTNTSATATGSVPATGTSVTSPPDGAAVDVVNPSLAIQKTVSTSGSCPGSELVTVLANTTVTYCYAVTNNGDTAISGVTVNDNGVIVAVGDLAPGATGSATSSITALADTNTPAVATGTTTVTGTSISSPPDGAAIDVVSPALSISTTVSTNGQCPGQEVVNVLPGTAVTWCYVVTNTGDTAVDGIVVTDSQYGTVPGAAFDLAPGESHTSSLNVSANVDVTLTASAAGTAPATGTPVVSPQDPAVVNVVSPLIDIDVTVSTDGACPGADSVSVPAGTTVVYCYKVTNNGDDVLANVNVTDGANNLITTLSDLNPGESTIFASTPVLVNGDQTVPATANATDIYGYPTSDSDTALVHALYAKLAIQKTVSLDGNCPGVELVTVLPGTAATYCYLVTNTGDTAVVNINVDDNGFTVPVGNLTPGSSTVVTRAVTATVDEDTFATAIGTNPATSQPVASAEDDATIDVVHPTLTIDKTVSLNGTCPGTNSVTVLPNTPVTYCYVVTNTGDTTIGDIGVTDGALIPVGTLAAGQSATVSQPIAVAGTDLDSFAVANGTDTATWTKVTSNLDDALVDVIHPSLSIATTVSTNGQCPGVEVVNVLAGTNVTWCYVVTNTGDVAVNGITGTDDVYGSIPGGSFSLAPGASKTLSRPATASVDTTVTAVAAGSDAVLGTPVVSNQDPAVVNVVHPSIDIDVTVSTNGTCPGLDSVTVPAGTNVVYCYTVSNLGDDVLDNVVVKDANGNTIEVIPVLGVGQSNTYAAAPVKEMADVTVTGTASATDQYGYPVSDTDTAVVHVLYANLHIVKTAPAQLTASSAGAPLAYTLAVSNIGQATAVHPVVTDTLPAGTSYVSATTTSGTCSFAGSTVTCALADLAPGASATITVNVKVTQMTGSVTNTASVTSSTPDSDLSDNTSSATTTLVGGGATRTLGFYANHPTFTQNCLASLGGSMNIGWFTIRDEAFDNEIDAVAAGNGPDKDTRKETGISMLMGILNANVDHYTNNAKRSALEQSKMQAAKQLVTAICNWKYLGTPPSFDINGMIAAMSGTNSALILSYSNQADAFNNSGDAQSIPMNPGPANSKYPWDDPTDPND
jgi:uncharacterized repeat protein (TIGR01451 family)